MFAAGDAGTTVQNDRQLYWHDNLGGLTVKNKACAVGLDILEAMEKGYQIVHLKASVTDPEPKPDRGLDGYCIYIDHRRGNHVWAVKPAQLEALNKIGGTKLVAL